MVIRAAILLMMAASCFGQLSIGNAFYPAGAIGKTPIPSPPVAGFTLWLNASDSSTMFTNPAGTVPAVADAAVGREVAYWQDKSTVGTNSVRNDQFTTTDFRPLLSNNVFNGKPALFFGNATAGSAGKFLRGFTNNTTFGAITGITVFVACSYQSAESSAFAQLWSFNNAATIFLEFRRDNSTDRIQATDGFAATATLSRAMTNGVGYCHTYRYWYKGNTDSPNGANGTVQCGRSGNVTNASAALAMTPLTNWFAIGSRGSLTVPTDLHWGGYMAEVIIYPWALSDVDYQSVTLYITNKYNFTIF